jgi:hypothetical protein
LLRRRRWRWQRGWRDDDSNTSTDVNARLVEVNVLNVAATILIIPRNPDIVPNRNCIRVKVHIFTCRNDIALSRIKRTETDVNVRLKNQPSFSTNDNRNRVTFPTLLQYSKVMNLAVEIPLSILSVVAPNDYASVTTRVIYRAMCIDSGHVHENVVVVVVAVVLTNYNNITRDGVNCAGDFSKCTIRNVELTRSRGKNVHRTTEFPKLFTIKVILNELIPLTLANESLPVNEPLRTMPRTYNFPTTIPNSSGTGNDVPELIKPGEPTIGRVR